MTLDADPGGRRRRRTRSGPGRSGPVRVRVVGVIAILLVTGLVVGRPGLHHRAGAGVAEGPVAAPVAAMSSAWFCAGTTDTPEGLAPGALVVSNVGSRPVTASITVLGSTGAHWHRRVAIGPDARRIVPETVPGTAAWAGAIVDLDAGAVTVEQEITGPLGTTISACATDGSAAWYFATGATRVNAASEITLLNPYPTAAVADLTFTTDQGREAPSQWQGLIVPAGRLVSIDLGTRLRRRSSIATTVTVTSGRVVAWKTDIVSRPLYATPLVGSAGAGVVDADPAAPVVGVTATLGAPAPSITWRWPEGSTADGVDERYVVYNPTTRLAHLALVLAIDGARARPARLDVTVGPEATGTIAPASAGIRAGAGYSATLTSTNGVPVVAERTVSEAAPTVTIAGGMETPAGAGAVAGAASVAGSGSGATGTASALVGSGAGVVGTGAGEMLGAVQTAPDWLVGAAPASHPTAEVIVVSDPGRGAVTVTLSALAGGRLQPVDGGVGSGWPGPLRVAAGAHVAVDLGPTVALGAVLVRATGPVIVERDLYGQDGTPGVSIALGVPLGP